MIGGLTFVLLRSTASRAPFGQPIPDPPRPRFVSEGVQIKDTDVLAKRIPPAFLEFLAAEPDGTIPLRYPYTSLRGGFTISHPMGTEAMETGEQQFAQTSLDAICQLKYNQALKRALYRFPPRRPGEKLTAYVARLRFELDRDGAKVTPQADKPVELPRYRLERVEYILPASLPRKGAGAGSPTPTEDEYHVLFIGPLGPRVLLADYITTPGLIDEARPQIDKIIHSLTPGPDLQRVMLDEDPDYGELAALRHGKPPGHATPAVPTPRSS